MTKRQVRGLLLAGLVAFGVAGVGAAAVRAGERGDSFAEGGCGHRHGRWASLSPEDRAAFMDARIAALHAGLKLTPDQEKLWPPVETALRDLAKQRQARRERDRTKEDAPDALRAMADASTARGEALRKLADATAPLYATLDEGQKRRATMLARPMQPFGGAHKGWHRHGPGGRDGDDD